MCPYLVLYSCKTSGTETSIYIYLDVDIISGPETWFQWASLLLFLTDYIEQTSFCSLPRVCLFLIGLLRTAWPHLTWGTCCDAAILAREQQPWMDKGTFGGIWQCSLGHGRHSDSVGHISTVLDEVVVGNRVCIPLSKYAGMQPQYLLTATGREL